MSAPAVIVAGALGAKPGNGGEAWVRAQWVLGLRRLGCRVLFVEELRADCAAARSWFGTVTRSFGFDDAAALVHGDEIIGMTAEALLAFAEEAALLVNLSGNLTHGAILRRPRRRAYVDLDPGFTQMWDANGYRGARLAGHDRYFTVGYNIGQPDCSVPTVGIEWMPVRPPVVLDAWPAVERASAATEMRWTTVGTWRNPLGTISDGARTYTLKHHQLREFRRLPMLEPQVFELALAVHPGDRAEVDALVHEKWRIVDAGTVAGDPAAFAQYVRGSGAEWSVAQGVYVETSSGWVSDRTACYLASGRPVVVQETGQSRSLPTGKGFCTFRSIGDAVSAVRAVARDWEAHSGAAREIAVAHFDSDSVLARVLEQCGVT